MTSATISLWKDCGYTEGSFIVPSQSDILPTPDYTFTLQAIPRDTLFTGFSVKEAFSELYDCSYLKVSYDFNNGENITVYGWIDAVSYISDTASSANTYVKWHVDLWRTYLSKAHFGTGTVLRRLPNNDDPPQSYPFKWSTVTNDKQNLVSVSDANIYWAFLNMTTKGVTTTLCWPCNITSTNLRYKIDVSGTSVSAPSYHQTITGLFDEVLAIDPVAIYGVWLSPIPPAPYSVSNVDTSKVVTMEPWGLYSSSTGGAFQAVRADISKADFYPESWVSINAKTSDYEQCIVTDLDSQPVLMLPWGIQAMFCYYRIINSDVSMYISFRFITKDSQTLDSATNGLECTIPLKTLPLSENARSSYIYSGQQEYDRRNMELQRRQAFINSITSTMGSTTTNAVMASLGNSKTSQGVYTDVPVMSGNASNPTQVGSLTGELGAKTNAGMGIGKASVLTAGVGVLGAGIDYYSAMVFNDKSMNATLDYMGMKTGSMILPSSGMDWILHGRMPMIVKLRWDDYSIQQRENDLLTYGAHVQETYESCQSLIDAGGPLQINNLNVRGAIPVQAKNYFRRRFSDGVKIV